MISFLTRDEFGLVLSSHTRTRTIKSEFLKGTIWEDMDLTYDWLVSFVEVDENGVLNISCIHPDYIKLLK